METLNPQMMILLVSLAIVSIVFVPSILVFALVHFKSRRFSMWDPASYGIVSTLIVFAVGFPLILIEPPFLAHLPSVLLPILGVCILGLMSYLMVSMIAKVLIQTFVTPAFRNKLNHVS